MPLPEGYRPRHGDELLVRAEVEFDVEPADTDVHLKIGYRKCSLELDKVDGLYCRKWKPHDRVQEAESSSRPAGPKLRGVVIAIFDTQVWVRWDESNLYPNSDGLATYGANDLELEPVEPESDVVYRNRILNEGIDADLESALINVASGADLDKIGDRFGLERKGIER